MVLMPSHENYPQIWVVSFKRQIDYEFMVIFSKIKATMGIGGIIKLINPGLENLVTVSQFSEYISDDALGADHHFVGVPELLCFGSVPFCSLEVQVSDPLPNP